ncbi:hypothetical protein D3C85_1774950 [compost metagenome]
MVFCIRQANADFVQHMLATIFCAHPLTVLRINSEIQRKLKAVEFGILNDVTNPFF